MSKPLTDTDFTDFTDVEKRAIIERALNRHGVYRCNTGCPVAVRLQFRRVAEGLRLPVHTAVDNSYYYLLRAAV